MARRVKRKAKVKRVRKRAPRKRVAKARRKQSPSLNKKAYWAAYKKLQLQVDRAYKKLKSGVVRKADPAILIRDKNALLLLLGECNYMARECMRISRA